MEIHLFETKLNEQGKFFLIRINKWAKFFYACTIATCIFDLIDAWLNVKSYSKYSDNYPSALKFQVIMDISFLIIYSVLLVFTGYFFYQFAGKSIKAVEQEDELGYNNALGFLVKHVAIAAILFALNSLWALMIGYVHIKLHY